MGQLDLNGRGGKIRTCDPLFPKQMRYQAALRPEPSALIKLLLRGMQALNSQHAEFLTYQSLHDALARGDAPTGQAIALDLQP